jgi:hypothetical protein
MKRFYLSMLCTAAVASAFLAATPEAHAIKAFKDEFEAKYLKPDSTEPADQALIVVVEEARCNVCHVKGESKKVRNAYGLALSELLDKKEDKEDTEKIHASMDKVAEMKSNPDDEASPTFGQLIAEGKLPGGPIEE